MAGSVWRWLPRVQQPDWPDADELDRVLAELTTRPGLVHEHECDQLRDHLAEVSAGRAFVLQAGDCAETFAANTPMNVKGQFALLAAMSERIADAGLPVITIGRIAGQYAKPRSAPVETRGCDTLPVYRGDAVNGTEFTAAARTPDAGRMLAAYDASAAALGMLGGALHTSHEALLLDYENALVRGRYSTSAHLLWIGERTRHPAGAHVDFVANLANPVAVKIGPGAVAADLLALIDRLDPFSQPGRLSLVARMGADAVRRTLPPLLAAVSAHAPHVRWMCDPMHGNTVRLETGLKTRHLDTIVDELAGFFEAHRVLGVHPGGVHLEVSGATVTECVGGTPAVRAQDLPNRYETACDPRLNSDQAMEIAAVVVDLLGWTTKHCGVFEQPAGGFRATAT